MGRVLSWPGKNLKHSRKGKHPVSAMRISRMCDDTPLSLIQNDSTPEDLCQKGYELLREGKFEMAAHIFHQALKIRPDFAEAHLGLASSMMPGEDYRRVLKRFHDWLVPARYMEIGVEDGESMALARMPIRSVGIDPSPRVRVDLSPNARIFEATSDDFFSTTDVKAVLGGPVDLVLIDGLHLFEQTLRDFINVEKCSRPTSVILVHDTLPLDCITSRRKQTTQFWSGDVWKIVPCLETYRKDLTIINIATPPTGLLAVTNLNPESDALEKNYDQILGEFLPLGFEAISERNYLADITANNWKLIMERLQLEK